MPDELLPFQNQFKRSGEKAIKRFGNLSIYPGSSTDAPERMFGSSELSDVSYRERLGSSRAWLDPFCEGFGSDRAWLDSYRADVDPYRERFDP